jgi:hypothetical protein
LSAKKAGKACVSKNSVGVSEEEGGGEGDAIQMSRRPQVFKTSSMRARVVSSVSVGRGYGIILVEVGVVVDEDEVDVVSEGEWGTVGERA